jgi:predicted phosphohydrolase
LRIAVASDLHLEQAELERFEHGDADLIVLAGDIHVSPLAVQNYLETLPPTIPKLVVLGNHEYDSWDEPALGTAEPLYRVAIEAVPNAHLLERQHFQLGDVAVLGATLWSDFRRGKETEAARFITQTIVADPCELIKVHRETVAWLKREIPAVHAAKRKAVVMTHMAPSYRSLSAEQQRHPLAGFFASDLERLIRELRPALWIHGHIHTALEYPLGATAIVANPRGNPGEKVNALGRSWTPKIIVV